jgi:branched-chain amino acid transport system substrate-binding protein
MKNAVELAIDEINEKGGIKGKRLELIAIDDKADPKEAVSIAHKFITDPQLYAVVGHLNSGCSIPASRVYAQANLLMISPSSTNPKLTQQGFKNVFRTCTTDNVQGEAAAEFAFSSLKKKKAVILHDKTAYGQGLAEEFKKKFKDLGGEILAFEGITEGDKDFTAILTRVKGYNPEILYFGGMFPEGGLIVKQARELGLKATIMSGDGLYDTEFIKIAGASSAEGTIVSFLVPPIDKLPQAKEFAKKYREKFGAIGPFSPYAYDATKIIIWALENTEKLTRESLIETVRKIKDFPGTTGTISFDEKGDTLRKAIYFYLVKDGKFEFLSSSEEIKEKS